MLFHLVNLIKNFSSLLFEIPGEAKRTKKGYSNKKIKHFAWTLKKFANQWENIKLPPLCGDVGWCWCNVEAARFHHRQKKREAFNWRRHKLWNGMFRNSFVYSLIAWIVLQVREPSVPDPARSSHGSSRLFWSFKVPSHSLNEYCPLMSCSASHSQDSFVVARDKLPLLGC